MSQSLRDPNFEELPVGKPTKDVEEISINAVDPREQAIAQMEEIHKKIQEEVSLSAPSPEDLEEIRQDEITRRNFYSRLELVKAIVSSSSTGTAKEVTEYAEELWTWITQK